MEYPPDADRRKNKRVDDIFTVTYRFRSTIDVAIRTPEQEYTGVAVDISAGGIGVEVTQRIETDTPIRVKFTLGNKQVDSEKSSQRSLELSGEVRHCKSTDNKAFRAGIWFDKITDEDKRFIAAYVQEQLQKK